MPDEPIIDSEQVDDSAIPAAEAPAADDKSAQPDVNPWTAIMDRDATEPVDDTAAKLEESLSEETPADEQIPEGKESDDEEAKKADSDEDKKPRAAKHKEALAKAEELETQLSDRDKTIAEKDAEIARINTILSEDGLDAEGVSTLRANQELFLDASKAPEAVDFITELPHGEAIAGELLKRAFNVGNVALDAAGQAKAETNRYYVLEQTLKTEFGLKSDIPRPLINKIMTWTASRFNVDAKEFEEDLDAELIGLQPDPEDDSPTAKLARESAAKVAELQGELEKVKQQTQPTEGNGKPAEMSQEDTIKALDTFEKAVFDESIAKIAPSLGFEVDKLPPIVVEAAAALARYKLGSSPIFVQNADWVLAGKASSPQAKFLRTQYANAMTAMVNETLGALLNKKAIAATKTAAPKTPAPKQAAPDTTKDKGALAPPAQPSGEKPNPWSQYTDPRR